MNIKIDEKYKQIKNVAGYPYNRTGEEWNVREITDTHIVLRNGYLGFGIEKEKFSEYFEKAKVAYTCQIEDAKVIRSGNATIVILTDGSKGISKCLPEDRYDPDKGFQIAYTKAKIKSLGKQLKQLIR
jgi:hypothetical protein